MAADPPSTPTPAQATSPSARGSNVSRIRYFAILEPVISTEAGLSSPPFGEQKCCQVLEQRNWLKADKIRSADTFPVKCHT